MNWNDYFTADFEAGTLIWKARPYGSITEFSTRMWNAKFAGKIAGHVNDEGYRLVSLFDILYKAHRIIFEMANGLIPEGIQIDHIDQDRSNNRLGNLRLATFSENARNTGIRSSNTSGFKGVSFYRPTSKWMAKITHNRRQIYLGYYLTAVEAHAAYCTAAKELHGEFSRTA